MSKIYIILFAMFILLSPVSAQIKGKTPLKTPEKIIKTITLSGEIKEKPWTKSTQSYCAQGSSYFVLQEGEKEYVLSNQSAVELSNYNNKRVEIKGFFERKVIKPTDDNEQRPVDIDGNDKEFVCEVLVVKKIKQLR